MPLPISRSLAFSALASGLETTDYLNFSAEIVGILFWSKKSASRLHWIKFPTCFFFILLNDYLLGFAD